jgi:hypothetical protein
MENLVGRTQMNPGNKPDRKQTALPLFNEEIVPVPTAKQGELAGALAELLLGVAKNSVPGEEDRGGSR